MVVHRAGAAGLGGSSDPRLVERGGCRCGGAVVADDEGGPNDGEIPRIRPWRTDRGGLAGAFCYVRTRCNLAVVEYPAGPGAVAGPL